MSEQSPRNPVVAAALKYHSLGWQVLPCTIHGDGRGSDGKAPTKFKDWVNLRLSEEEIPKTFGRNDNVGVILGHASGNLVDLDLDCPEAVRAAKYCLPETGAIFGRSGVGFSHWLYICEGPRRTAYADPAPPEFAGQAGKTLMLCELRGEGGQTVLPPSRHVASGETVSWAQGHRLPPATVRSGELLKAVQRLAAVALLGRRWVSGGRQDMALELAGWLQRGGVPRDNAEHLLTAICAASGDKDVQQRMTALRTTYEKAQADPEGERVGRGKLVERWGERVVETAEKWLGIRRGLGTRPTGKEGSGGKGRAGVNALRYELELELKLHDAGNAERLARLADGRLLHCAELGGWHVWDGRLWALDRTNLALRYAGGVARLIEKEAEAESDPDRAALIRYHAAASSDVPRWKSMLEALAAGRGVASIADEFDARPELITVGNGTLDLAAGPDPDERWPLLPPDPAHRITRATAVPYEPGSKCPEWEKFLGRIFAGSREMIDFVQRFLGYCLLGGNREQRLAVFYGSGANGKSVLTETVSDVFGDYSAHTSTDVLLARDNAGNNTYYALAQLRGARLVTASESRDGDTLNEGLVKQMTGGEQIQARLSHQNFFSYRPLFTPILSTNSRPRVRDTSDGIWRRLLLLPFTVQIPEAERDVRLKDKLLAEAPGILRWILDGLTMYRAYAELCNGQGLQPPDPVTTASASYREEQDIVRQWLRGLPAVDADARAFTVTLGQAALAAFNEWAAENGYEPPGHRKDFSGHWFYAQLRQKGYEVRPGAHNKMTAFGLALPGGAP